MPPVRNLAAALVRLILGCSIAAALPAAEHPARTVTLQLPAAAEETSVFVSMWRDGTRKPVTSKSQRAGSVDLVTTDAPCHAGSILVVESRTRIGATTLGGTCGVPIRVGLVRKASVSARVTAPNGIQLPPLGTLRFDQCGPDRPAIEIPFSIANYRFQTAVPASCAEATIRIVGFAPVRLPSRRLESGETRDIGTIALVRGAAATLRVLSRKDGQPVKGVRITAVRKHELASMQKDLESDRAAVAAAVTDSAGRATIAGLPEEQVVFLLQMAGRTWPQISEPYGLRAGKETVIGDLLLDAPANLFVTVKAPRELAALELRDVELVPAGDNSWPRNVPIRGVLTQTGAIVPDVPPGTWTVQATGRLKNGFAVNAAKTTVQISTGVDAYVTLAINDAVYRGRVTRDGSPIEGVIDLKPADRRGGRRNAVATIAPDGTFQVLLEGNGQYSARVQEKSGGGITLSRYVTFEDADDEARIELPTGRVRGRVVDSAGSPLAGVAVSGAQQLSEPTGIVGARTGGDGRFVLESVAPGTWDLVAETDRGRSEPATVSVGESVVEGVVLVLEPTRKVTVRVVDTTGVPVRDVFVGVDLLKRGSFQPTPQVRLTNAEGTAEFRLSPSQQETPTNVVVSTMDLRISCALRLLDGEQTISIPPSFGELRLVGGEMPVSRGAQRWLVSASGCAVPFLGTRIERESTGESSLVFPRLASGAWRYVETRTADELLALLAGRGAALPTIATVTVTPASVTRVNLSSDRF